MPGIFGDSSMALRFARPRPPLSKRKHSGARKLLAYSMIKYFITPVIDFESIQRTADTPPSVSAIMALFLCLSEYHWDESTEILTLALSTQSEPKHSPAFLVAVGDPYQLGPFVYDSHSGTMTNPWSKYLKRSSLERAVSVSGIVDAALRQNHRGRASLTCLPSSLIYHGTIMSAATSANIWPDKTKACQRVLIELQGAQTEKLGSSSFNTEHVKYACAMALDAVKDDALKGLGGKDKTILIIAFYKAQAHMYGAELDRMLYDGLDEPRAVEAATAVSAEETATKSLTIAYFRLLPAGADADRRKDDAEQGPRGAPTTASDTEQQSQGAAAPTPRIIDPTANTTVSQAFSEPGNSAFRDQLADLACYLAGSRRGAAAGAEGGHTANAA
ncbi:hypothetical protein VTK56DRAFT_2401 [Thermocarpiscus australiensis]